MLDKLRDKYSARFTKWYVRKGYAFGYDDCYNGIWNCPWYIKPLLFLFSPSVYSLEAWGNPICTGFIDGFTQASAKSSESFEKMAEYFQQLGNKITKG